jgi:hypothetical protein
MAVEHTVKAPDQEAMDVAEEMLGTQGDVEAYGEKEAPKEEPEVTDEDQDGLEASEEEALDDSDSEGDSEDDESDVDELRFVEIEINGTKYEVPEDLKDGYLMQADYTRKTQSLQDYKKEVELQQKQLQTTQKEHEFINEIQPEINNLGYLNAQIQQIDQNLQQNVNNLPSDELFKMKIQADGLRDQATTLKSQLEGKYQEFQNSQEQAYTELLNQGAEILKQTIPDWTPDKQKELREFALNQGFNEQEVSSIIDPRHVRVLWAASQYEALQSKAPQAADKVTTKIKQKARKPMPDATRKKLDNRKKIKSRNVSDTDKADIIGQEAADWFLGKG